MLLEEHWDFDFPREFLRGFDRLNSIHRILRLTYLNSVINLSIELRISVEKTQSSSEILTLSIKVL